MAFKPKSNGTKRDFDSNIKYPTPESGNSEARISMIIDLGTQEREDFEDPVTKEVKPQKPCQQVVVFADLVEQVVDYGGDIGEAQYRLCLNKNFKGVVEGINFTAVPPRDAKGDIIKDKLYSFHPANMLTKIAKATGHTEILGVSQEHNMDIERLLGEPLMIDVSVKETDSGKTDDKGEPIIYKNVNVGTLSTVPKKNLANFGKLQAEPLLITFDNATPEAVKFIRKNLIEKIKLAQNYAGSNMQKAIEALEGKSSETKQPSKPKVELPDIPDEDLDPDQLPF